jgi:hypothetical protein
MSLDSYRENHGMKFYGSFFSFIVLVAFVFGSVFLLNRYLGFIESFQDDKVQTSLEDYSEYRLWRYSHSGLHTEIVGHAMTGYTTSNQVALIVLIDTVQSHAQLCTFHHNARTSVAYDSRPVCHPDRSAWLADLKSHMLLVYRAKQNIVDTEPVQPEYMDEQYTRLRRALTLHLGSARREGKI